MVLIDLSTNFSHLSTSQFLQTLDVAEDRFAKIMLYLQQRYAIGMKSREKWHKAVKTFRFVGLDDCSEGIRIHGTIVALPGFSINK